MGGGSGGRGIAREQEKKGEKMGRDNFTVRMNEEERSWLERCGLPAGVQLRDDLTRFRVLVRMAEARLANRFTNKEALALCEALANFTAQPDVLASLAQMLAIVVRDADRTGKIGLKWGINPHVLAGTLSQLDILEALALHDLVRRYWGSADEDRAQLVKSLFLTKDRMMP